ncbi:MAG: guanylate kinase [Candidatus Krumholzibacteriia bacterium]
MLVLISGPSGAGKSTFVERLLASDRRLAFSVSVTTRPPRPGEVDGEDYHFVEETGFQRLVAANAFVEWARVHGHSYGTRTADLRALQEAGRVPLLDLDVQGGCSVIDRFGPELVSVFLFPPSWPELERRLRSRGTDSEEVIRTRLDNARWEVGFADRYGYWLVNDDLDAAVERMRAIITAECCRRERQAAPPLSAEGQRRPGARGNS